MAYKSASSQWDLAVCALLLRTRLYPMYKMSKANIPTKHKPTRISVRSILLVTLESSSCWQHSLGETDTFSVGGSDALATLDGNVEGKSLAVTFSEGVTLFFAVGFTSDVLAYVAEVLRVVGDSS